LLNASKLADNTSTESEQGSQSYSISSISFTSRSRGKSYREAKGSINPTPTHLHHTTISLHHLHHLYHNSAPQTPRVHTPATYNSHHGTKIIEPHLHQNIMKTLILLNFSCATKLP
jgi:hypothetical protein